MFALVRLRKARLASSALVARFASPRKVPVIGDRGQLHQLMHNIISNAFKYGGEGKPVRAVLDGVMKRLICPAPPVLTCDWNIVR